jgi:hypothetical protein
MVYDVQSRQNRNNVFFTNLEHPEINFMFEDNIISTIESHRHLGVALSTDAKWNAHIENIVSSVSKHINILRKLKFKINRSNLEKRYLVYIRPIFEYASEVWDNCGYVNASKLERLQLEAARIFTGLCKFQFYISRTWVGDFARKTDKKKTSVVL